MQFGRVLKQIQTFVARQTRKERRALKLQRLKDAFRTGQRLIVDFGIHENRMTEMDRRRLVSQTKLLYESNMNSRKPFALTFAELRKDSEVFTTFKKMIPTLADMVVNISEEPISEIFSKDDMVYLTPDSTEVLQEIDPSKIYILGGLVDYQVTKNITQRKASKLDIKTKRLPIVEYMDKKEGRKHSYSKILTINQVFDILMAYQETKDWRVALSVGIPQRRGYIPKPE